MPDDPPRHGRGRPPLDRNDPSFPVTVKFPGRVFDRICQRATAERVTVPEFIRRALCRQAPGADDPSPKS